MRKQKGYSMKKRYIFTISIVYLFFVLVGCKSKDNTIKDIKADSYSMAYEDSVLYYSHGVADKSNVESLVEKYNNIQLMGTTEQQVSWEKSVGIIFYYKNQNSGNIYIFDNGICSFNGFDMYNMSDDSDIYDDALQAYTELKGKYKQ
jgi:hypothetical protein